MLPTMLQGALIGLTVSLAMMGYHFYAARSGSGLAGEIAKLLAGKPGGMTLPELAQALGGDSFFRRGQVVQALTGLTQAGKVKVHQAPEGTPQLQKVHHIRYELLAG
jgi:hypothetical protein